MKKKKRWGLTRVRGKVSPFDLWLQRWPWLHQIERELLVSWVIHMPRMRFKKFPFLRYSFSKVITALPLLTTNGLWLSPKLERILSSKCQVYAFEIGDLKWSLTSTNINRILFPHFNLRWPLMISDSNKKYRDQLLKKGHW